MAYDKAYDLLNKAVNWKSVRRTLYQDCQALLLAGS